MGCVASQPQAAENAGFTSKLSSKVAGARPAGPESAPQKAAKGGKLRAVLSSTPEDGPTTAESAPTKLLPGRRVLESDASAVSSRIGRGVMSPRSDTSSDLGSTTLSIGTTNFGTGHGSSTGMDNDQDARRQSVALSLPDRSLGSLGTSSDIQTLRTTQALAGPASPTEQPASSKLPKRSTGDRPALPTRLWRESRSGSQPAYTSDPGQPDPIRAMLLNSLASPTAAAGAQRPDGLKNSPSLEPERMSSLSLPMRRRLQELAGEDPRYSLDSDRETMRGCLAGMFVNDRFQRPTYERDAEDDEFATANGLSMPKFDQQRRDLPQARPNAGRFGTMAFAMPPAAEEGEESTEDDPASFQAYSSHTDNFGDLGIPSRETGEDDGGGDGGLDGGMGSMTGWRAIAAQVMADGGSDDQEVQRSTESRTDMPHNLRSSDVEGDADEFNEDGETSEPAPVSKGLAGMPVVKKGGRFMSIVDVASRQRRPEQANALESTSEVAFRPGGGFYVQYECLEKLGEGAFGEALKARRRKDGAMFVVKMMHSSSMTDKAKEEARNEVHLLAALKHPNIVNYWESFLDSRDGRLLIIMELCEDGDLATLLKKRGGKLLSEDEIMLKFVQICLGLMHVHNKGIIHRDLKTNNIFCCANGIVKLGDFGISKMLTGGKKLARTMVGTPYYMSPEIIKGRNYDRKTDIWAIGCVLYELCTLRKAFDASNLAAITVKVMSGKFAPIPDHYSDDMKTLIDSLIRKTPATRPEVQEVLALDFVRTHLMAYEQHVLKNVHVKQRSSFMATVHAHLPGSVPDDALESLAEEDTVGPLELDGPRSSSAAKDDLADEDQDKSESELREERANEESLVRAKLRAFKAARPRTRSHGGFMATSASMPDLAAAALLSQSRGHSDPSRFSALLASGSLASNGHSTGASSSLPLEQKSTSLEVGEEDLPPGVPSDAESSLSHEASTEFDVGGQAAATRTKSGHRLALGDIQSMLEALPEEETAETPTSNAATGSDAEAGGGTPDAPLSPTASEGLDSPSGKQPRGKGWFRGSRPSAAGLLSPRLRKQQLSSISMRSANTVIGDIQSILHVPGKNVASLQVDDSASSSESEVGSPTCMSPTASFSTEATRPSFASRLGPAKSKAR